MQYNKEYAKKVFELIPGAMFVAVDESSQCCWFCGAPRAYVDMWTGPSDYGELGKVECDNWRESLIGREDI